MSSEGGQLQETEVLSFQGDASHHSRTEKHTIRQYHTHTRRGVNQQFMAEKLQMKVSLAFSRWLTG